jgi:hypothetical protein
MKRLRIGITSTVYRKSHWEIINSIFIKDSIASKIIVSNKVTKKT